MPSTSLLAVFGFSVAISFAAVISPGPVTAAVITEAPRQGWRVGPLVASGHSLVEFAIIALIGFGLSSGLASPAIQHTIAIAGGILLIFLGGSYIFSAWRGAMRLPETDIPVAPRSKAALLGLGVLTTLSNPFWYAWWVTVASGFLSQAWSLGFASVAAFYIGHISTDMVWNTLLSTATGASRRLMSDRIYTFLILITGGFMLYIGVLFIRTSM